MGRDKVLGTCAVRYCALPLQKRKKLGLGAGKQLERARREGGGRLEEEECVERDRHTQRRRERKDEQGTGYL